MLRGSDRTAPTPEEVASRLVGMRRVSWVRITVVDGHARCEAVGVGHRVPTVREVSLDTAVALAATGVPSVIRTRDTHAEGVPRQAGAVR